MPDKKNVGDSELHLISKPGESLLSRSRPCQSHVSVFISAPQGFYTTGGTKFVQQHIPVLTLWSPGGSSAHNVTFEVNIFL